MGSIGMLAVNWQGEADLTFIMSHSSFIPEALGSEAGKLRTISPLFERLFFLFSKLPRVDTLNTAVQQELSNLRISARE